MNAADPTSFHAMREAVTRLDQELLGGPRRYTWNDLREQGLSERAIESFWRTMGFTMPERDQRTFTDADLDAMRDFEALSDDDHLSTATAENLIRGLAYHLGRLSLWQTESIIEQYRADGVPDAEARARMLTALPDLLGELEREVSYVWRRQLAWVTSRAGAEVLQIRAEAGAHANLPLQRAVGFADLVSFTTLAQKLDGSELVSLIQSFEAMTRDIVSQCGGRVVKTVGDEVMFITDTAEDGAEIALAILEELARRPDLPEVRIGFAWGHMFSRYGDVYGPTVNLAARLESSAQPGTVVVDGDTAASIDRNLPGRYRFSPIGGQELKGIGLVDALVLTRGQSSSYLPRQDGALPWQV